MPPSKQFILENKMDTDENFIPKASSTNNQVLSNFSDRQKNLFDHLKKAEDENKLSMPEPKFELVSESSRKRKRSETKSFQGKESIFKRPEDPISKCLPVRNIPDFRKNPHKWTKYSLDNVDISDKGNTSAALSFLREMEERKQNEAPMETDDNRIVFKKSTIVRKKVEDDDEKKEIFKGSKIVMPEYVVGQKKSNKKSDRVKVSTEKSKEVKLDHLLEYEDDE